MRNTCILIIVAILIVYFIVRSSSAFEVCYGKNDHLNQSIWGPHAWEFLHSVAFAYPEDPTTQDKKSVKNFAESFACILPCSVCKDNFKTHIKSHPLKVNSRREFFDWTVGLHNLVNRHLGKPQYNSDEVFNSYKKKYNR